MRFEGKAAVVTGAASGIGRCVVRGLVTAGARVVGCDRNDTTLGDLVGEFGDSVVPSVGDVSDSDYVQASMNLALDRLGDLDIVVNCAGIGARFGILDHPDDLFDKVMAVNLRGPWLFTKYGAKAMIGRGHGGSIVTVGSISGISGQPMQSSYGPSKAGAGQLMKVAALELANFGIRCNAVLPGGTLTPLLVDDPSTDPAQLRAQLAPFADKGRSIPIGRLAEPEEIASTVLFLASEDSSYMTGSQVVVDGGATAGSPRIA